MASAVEGYEYEMFVKRPLCFFFFKLKSKSDWPGRFFKFKFFLANYKLCLQRQSQVRSLVPEVLPERTDNEDKQLTSICL